MALTQTSTAQPGLWARWVPALRRYLGVITVELVVLSATLALAVMVTVHAGPLPGDVGLTVWWQHLVRPNTALKAVFDEVSALNWPLYATITVAIVVAIFALLRRWLDILVLLGLEVADGANWRLNTIVHRPRPAGFGVFVDRHITGYYSFPSGHVEHAVVLLGSVVLAPYALRVGRHVTGAWLLAVSAGMAYALSALFTKQVANLVGAAQVLPLLVVLLGAAVCAVLGFMGEVGALDRAQAADVAPVYRALQIMIPIAVAPLLFGEHWPSAIGAQSLLAGGLLLTVAGILLVSRRHNGVARAYAQVAR